MGIWLVWWYQGPHRPVIFLQEGMVPFSNAWRRGSSLTKNNNNGTKIEECRRSLLLHDSRLRTKLLRLSFLQATPSEQLVNKLRNSLKTSFVTLQLLRCFKLKEQKLTEVSISYIFFLSNGRKPITILRLLKEQWPSRTLPK